MAMGMGLPVPATLRIAPGHTVLLDAAIERLYDLNVGVIGVAGDPCRKASRKGR